MGRVLLILGLMALLPATARAEVTVQLGHIKLHLPVPDGYCALDVNRVRDSALYDFEAKIPMAETHARWSRLNSHSVPASKSLIASICFQMKDRPSSAHAGASAAGDPSSVVEL